MLQVQPEGTHPEGLLEVTNSLPEEVKFKLAQVKERPQEKTILITFLVVGVVEIETKA